MGKWDNIKIAFLSMFVCLVISPFTSTATAVSGPTQHIGESALEVYPPTPLATFDNELEFYIEGTAIRLETQRVQHPEKSYFFDSSRARFAISSGVDAQLTVLNHSIAWAYLRSATGDLPLNNEGSTLDFKIPGPGHYYLKLGGHDGFARTVFFWADDLTTARITPDDPAVIDITDHGVFSDPELLQTGALQSIIDSAPGGSIIYFPSGIYRSGELTVARNDLTIYLERGALLKGSDYRSDYGGAFITIENARHIRMAGAGTIDANGVVVWNLYNDEVKIHNVNIINSYDVVFEDLLFRDSNSWAIHIIRSTSFSAFNVKIFSGKDGYDPDSSRDVWLENIFVQSMDDSVAVKTRYPGTPTANVTVRNGIFGTWKSAIKIGTETRDDITNINFENIDVMDADRGIAIYGYDGGDIRTVRYKNIRLNSKIAFIFRLENRSGSCLLEDIYGENITANFITRSEFRSSADRPVQNITLKNVSAYVFDPISDKPYLFESNGNVSNVLIDGLHIHWMEDISRWQGITNDDAIKVIMTAPEPPEDCWADVSDDRWVGEYFNNRDLNGNPAMIRDDGNGFLDFDWGSGSPRSACFIGPDQFSARWTRKINFDTGLHRFSVTGDDGVRLYVDGSRVLDRWIDQSPTTYTVDVPLTAGDHLIELEYYENGGGAVARLSWKKIVDNCQASVSLDRWQGAYFDNMALSGSPVMIRDDGAGFLNFNWNTGSPGADCGLGADRFSARWTREVEFGEGLHRFAVTADDGFRLYVDGQLQLSAWTDQPPTTYSADVYVTAGSHTIELEYYENLVSAVIQLSWEEIDDPCSAAVPPHRWQGEYFDNLELSGSPAMVRDDGDGFLDFNWGSGSPAVDCGIGNDRYSARWTRDIEFSEGTYRFTVTGDDGLRLYIDGFLELDRWVDQSPTTYTVDVTLSGGIHTVQLAYYENGGGAVARLSWAALADNPCFTTVWSENWQGEYFDNMDLSGNPVMVRDDGNGFLDFDWGGGSPDSDCGVDSDGFAVRWRREVDLSEGTYRFTVTSDDGFRLYVDDDPKLERWVDQSPATYTVDVELTGGLHALKLEYYENGGGAVARLSWQKISEPQPDPDPDPDPEPGPAPDYWDPRLDDLGITWQAPPLIPGQTYWKLVHAEFLDESEAGGLHHMFYKCLDVDGNHLSGVTVVQEWVDGNIQAATKAAPDWADIPIWGGWCPATPPGPYSGYVGDGMPTYRLVGMGLPCNRHVAYRMIFQKAVAP